jgi:hypothetical protein
MSRHAHLFVAVILTLLLGVITVTYLTVFPLAPPTVSCTTATHCTAPDRPRPAPEGEQYI